MAMSSSDTPKLKPGEDDGEEENKIRRKMINSSAKKF